MLLSLASTRGEQPVVLSFKSRRRSARGLVAGDWYSRISRTHLRALSMGAPHSDGWGIRFESFRLSQSHDRRSNPLQSVAGELLYWDRLHKVLYAKPAPEPGHRTGG